MKRAQIASWGKAQTGYHRGSSNSFSDHVWSENHKHTICKTKNNLWHLTCKQPTLPFSVRSAPHILKIAIILGLKPISFKYQEAQLFQDVTALYWTSSLELDYWFTCVLGAEIWCHFQVISQVFVCSRSLLCCVCPVVLSCSVQSVTSRTNPWPTVLVFLLSQGWRSIPFKRSQLYIQPALAWKWK